MDVNRWLIKRLRLKVLPYPIPTEIPNKRREYLGELINKLEYKVGAEIGVWQGDFSKSLLIPNPDLHLYCIDPWEYYADYHEDIISVNQDGMDYNLAIAKQKLAGHNVTFIRKRSMAAVDDFADNSLDFVYIDGHHGFSYVANDLEWWYKKVRPGGLVCGHDYYGLKDPYRKRSPNYRVFEAVNGFVQAFDIHPWFVIGRQRDERHRSFIIVKK
jgi:SAM-dependent methyltransferase